MKKETIRLIYDDIKALSELTRITEYFTVHGEFDLQAFRKYQWRIYGKIELAYELNIIETYEYTKKLKRHVREIAKNYRYKLGY